LVKLSLEGTKEKVVKEEGLTVKEKPT